MSPPKPSLDELRIERKADAPSGSRLWLWVAAVIIVFLCLGTAWWVKKPQTIEVRTVAAREAAAGTSLDRTVLNASGYVTARRQATVSSKVTGKVIEVFIEEGFKVKEGQVLARLDDTNTKASLQLAEAQLASAQAALEETRVRIKEAEQNLRRVADLAKSSISAQADLDHAEADAASLKARLEQQKADALVADRSIATWKQQLEDTVIRAPFSGIVTSKNAQPGEMISPISAGGGFTRTGICTIVDMESLEVEIDVNESYINRVQSGQPVEAALDAYADWKIPCKVIAIIPTADRQKSTVKVRVGFDKLDPRILPEMSIKVAFREATTSSPTSARGVIIPKSAVVQQDNRDIVFVANAGRAERRAVTISSSMSDDVTLTSGVASGERVIINASPTLADGASVKESKP